MPRIHRLRLAALPVLLILLATTARGEKQPADSLGGPPHVTCRAWAIADGKTGEILWGHEAATPAKAASTTKMMCATVVLQLAAADPKVLDEVVTFSKFADDTGGSTAAIGAGEKIVVRDCLYALLLPSGNDAGNALAEHFNDRLAPPESPPGTDASDTSAGTSGGRSNFIAEMNRLAARIGLADTTYRIPYGDGGTATDMTTTPRDLVKLAHFAQQDPLFRKITSTPRYECDVTTVEGSIRRAAWDNTNKLLTIEGYDGVKTGTTTQAGACLVSSARRGDDHLLIAVLGSTSPDARFTDTRNLYRWAWQQRGHRK